MAPNELLFQSSAGAGGETSSPGNSMFQKDPAKEYPVY